MEKQRPGSSCSRCGSEEVVPKARILDRGAANYPLFSLTVQVQERPEAVLLKGRKGGSVYARLCGHCGYVELYAEDHEELYRTYEKGRRGE